MPTTTAAADTLMSVLFSAVVGFAKKVAGLRTEIAQSWFSMGM